MSTKTEPKRVPLLKYWTIRYLLVLLSSLIIVASLAVYWTQEREKKYNLQLNRLFAQEMAERIGSEGELVISSAMWNRLLSRGRSYFAGDEQAQKPLPLILIVDREGKVIFQNRTIPDERLLRYLMEKGSAAEEVMDTLDAGERAWYIVAEPIWRGDWLIGSVFVISEKSVRFSMPLRQVFPWVIVILCLGLSGWMVLYWLSRKLTDPIRRVAAAASQLRQGQYQVELPRDLREQELYELTHSFSEMASRLKRLEELRTELLAGVTHELKTPITSIGGLLRAIRDRVVTGEEAEEFLEISLGETQRLQKMVEDLLEFNAYATGAVSIRAEVLSLDGLVREMADRWKVMNPHPAIRLQTTLPEEMMRVRGMPTGFSRFCSICWRTASRSSRIKGRSTSGSTLGMRRGRPWMSPTTDREFRPRNRRWSSSAFTGGRRSRRKPGGWGWVCPSAGCWPGPRRGICF